MPRPSEGSKGLDFERVKLDELVQTRRGKHHEMAMAILKELKALPDGEAMKISLASVPDVSLANLRAAVSRVTSTHGIKVASYSDDKDFYIWRKTAKTSAYERATRKKRK